MSSTDFRLAPQPSECSEDTINALVDGAADLTVAEFKRLGDKASYHFADDTCREWDLADKAKIEALAIFDAHPELHARFREVAKDFLWSLQVERKP